MNVGESVRAGLSELWAYKARTVLQTLGVALGAASFILTVALIKGGREQDRRFMEDTGGVTKLEVRKKTSGRMRLFSWGASLGLTLEDLEAVENAVEPFGAWTGGVLGVNGRAAAHGEQTRSSIKGVCPASLSMDNRTIKYGRYITEGDMRTDAPVAVVGTTVARRLFNAEDVVGLEIRIVPRKWDNTATRPPNRYRIVGVFHEKVFRREKEGRNRLEWMNRHIHIPLTSAMSREMGKRSVGNIQVKARRIEDVRDIKRAMEGALSRVRRGESDYTVMSRAERLEEWEERGMVYEAAIGGAGAISLLVGGIVIMNILLASFTQRIREVGLRKALGARDTEIFAQFLVESVLVAGSGGLAGILLGVALSGTVSEMMRMSLSVSPSVVLMGLAVAAGTGFFFGLYPGFRAARLDPVVALRYQ